MTQTAFLIPTHPPQPALRCSGIRGLGDTSMPDRDELGGGLNYYFFGHNLKLQVDYFRTWPNAAPVPGDTAAPPAPAQPVSRPASPARRRLPRCNRRDLAGVRRPQPT